VKSIVGLGNPGHTFHRTRHNVGFLVIEACAMRHQVRIDQRVVSLADARPASVYGDYTVGAQPVRLLMPLTMMNESGEALNGSTVPLQDLLIVCDDVNLPLGTIRLRPQGGAGGHHGLASCCAVLGTEDVPRLRVGVGIEPLPRDLEDFVLAPFQASEWPLVQRAVEQAAEACDSWVTEGIDVAMNRYNTAVQKT